jgi:hypothetical protein
VEITMNRRVTVNSLIALRDGCPISYEVGGSGSAWVRLGTERDGVAFDVESEALRELVRVGTEALTQMDAQYALEMAEDS